MDFESAEAFFYEAANEEHDPENTLIFDDHQKQRVYDWEKTFVDNVAREITEDQALDIISKVSRDYGIEPPELIWNKHTNLSTYDESGNEIDFGHRDTISLLHELAHAIHHNAGRDDIAHAPRFVWIAIELYHHYAGLNLSYLVTSAHKNGILGDMESPQNVMQDGYAKPALKKHRKP